MLNIYWFRKDLRLGDNKGLSEFIKNTSDGNTFSFLYIKNKNSYYYFGEKRISFLCESLKELNDELKSFGLKLQIIEGKSSDVFKRLTDKYNNVSVYANRQVEPYCISRDIEVRDIIEETGGKFITFTDTTIFDSGEIKNGNGEQYKVFTPFKNQCLRMLNESYYKNSKIDLTALDNRREVIFKNLPEYDLKNKSLKLSKSGLLKGGRNEGIKLLKNFYENGLTEYKTQRDYPAIKGTSLLSAHLHFGTVGIRECFRTAFIKLNKVKTEDKQNEIHTWINELFWREFYYNITFHNPQIAYESFKKDFDKLKWNNDDMMFTKWCEGKTGFPIVDAGMRQLNKEGWMHNRVRMIVSMFLTKDLLIDWRLGEKYFAEKLIDLDFSNNNGGWQWSASTGVDSQPYFRIFNPYLQSKKFDPEGKYIRKYLPELKSLPAEFIHEPNLMEEQQQKLYGVIIGKDYPAPVIEHKVAKEEVIRRFKELSSRILY